MFTLIGNDVVRYNGGFREWFKCWTEKLLELGGNLAPDTVRGYFGSSYNRLREFIENPLEMPVKFYLCEDGENRHCDNAADFMRSISELREGDCLYIGAVLAIMFDLICLYMDKETKIDMLLSLLAKVMYQDSLPAASSDPTVVFLSSSEVQLIESSGCIPVNKYYDTVPLYELIRKVVDYLYEDEEKHWYETILSSSDVPEDNMDYNPELCPEHIFHSIRKLKELISL